MISITIPTVFKTIVRYYFGENAIASNQDPDSVLHSELSHLKEQLQMILHSNDGPLLHYFIEEFIAFLPNDLQFYMQDIWSELMNKTICLNVKEDISFGIHDILLLNKVVYNAIFILERDFKQFGKTETDQSLHSIYKLMDSCMV